MSDDDVTVTRLSLCSICNECPAVNIIGDTLVCTRLACRDRLPVPMRRCIVCGTDDDTNADGMCADCAYECAAIYDLLPY